MPVIVLPLYLFLLMSVYLMYLTLYRHLSPNNLDPCHGRAFQLMSTGKCFPCSLDFIDYYGSVACDLCDTWYHFTCTNLTQDAIQLHCNNPTITWICSTCENNTHCAKCNIKFAVDSREISICCDHCDKYFHKIIRSDV